MKRTLHYYFRLTDKLIKRKVPPDIIELIVYYLRNQTAQVRWCDAFGPVRSVNIGVRQGGILSAHLFNLYIDDFIDKVSELGHGCKLNGYKVNIIAYADDVVLISNSLRGLNTLYTKTSEELLTHKLFINHNKTKAMIFSSRKNNNNRSEILLCNHNFEIVKTFKYLGHQITCNLSESEDATFRLRILQGSFWSLRRSFPMVDSDVFLFLFMSYCQPLYGLTIWNLTTILRTGSFRAFEIGYSNIIKSIFHFSKYESTHFVFNAHKILTIQNYIIYHQVKYFRRIITNPQGIFYMIPSIKNCYISEALENLCEDRFSVNLWTDDLDAIHARIHFVQDRH